MAAMGAIKMHLGEVDTPTSGWCVACWQGSSRSGLGCRSSRSSRTAPITTSTHRTRLAQAFADRSGDAT
jgi:hypothetical protein